MYRLDVMLDRLVDTCHEHKDVKGFVDAIDEFYESIKVFYGRAPEDVAAYLKGEGKPVTGPSLGDKP